MEHAVKLTITGYEKLMADNVQEAKTYFLKALDINPENPFALMNMGVVFEKEGNPEKALEMYQAVVNVGTTETAIETSDKEKNGALLVDIAREHAFAPPIWISCQNSQLVRCTRCDHKWSRTI